MKVKNPFDDIAEQYDLLFTRSLTGMEQRKIIWRYLQRSVFPGMEVLEVNCGTGEDAFYLSGLECKVTATDASSGMIMQCLKKQKPEVGAFAPVFIQASINELDTVLGEKKFDLVFSNFSGLNCLDHNELQKTAALFHSFLRPDRKMIFVVFGTKCVWEKFYFFLKGKNNEINRRNRNGPVFIEFMNSGMQIFYYSPAEIRKHFEKYFKCIDIKPVGLVIPPTYLERFFEHRKILFKILTFAERLTEKFSLLSNLADHYLIEFRKV